MPISIEWEDEEKTIILMQYGETYTPEEMFAAYDQMQEMLDDIQHQAHIVTNIGQVLNPPNLLSQFPAIRRKSPALTHPNAGLIIHVAPLQEARSMIAVFLNAYPEFEARYRIVESFEEVFEVIAEWGEE